MKFLTSLVLLALLWACSSDTTKRDLDPTQGYRTSGVEQFFLPELPNWSNSSILGKCFKKKSVHYLDFIKLKEAYQLSYTQMVELQAQYNDRLENYFRSATVRFLRPVEEASFFSNTLEQVRAGVQSLKLPAVNEVEVIWFESYEADELKQILKSDRYNEKLPILFSSCHSRQGLQQWLAHEQLEDVGAYLISAEWLTPYSSQNELVPGLQLELGEIIGKNIKVTFNKSKKIKTASELIFP